MSGGKINIMNSDYFQEKPQKNAILNLDNTGKGTHWTAIKDMKDYYLYVDSFGVEPPFTHNINKEPKLIIYDPEKTQKNEEKNCGKRAFNSLIAL